jgi:hypothetical protein
MIGRILKGVVAAALLLPAGVALAQTQTQTQPQAKAQSPRPEGCVIEQWPAYLAPEPQTHQIRERLQTDAGEIWAIEFGPPEGEYAKLFLFFLVHGGCERKVFLVGTFAFQNDFARERGEIKEGERVYHLDLFEPEKQTTLEMRYEAPRYEEMREMALNLLR